MVTLTQIPEIINRRKVSKNSTTTFLSQKSSCMRKINVNQNIETCIFYAFLTLSFWIENWPNPQITPNCTIMYILTNSGFWNGCKSEC